MAMERSTRGAIVKTFILLAVLFILAGIIGYSALTYNNKETEEPPAPTPVIPHIPQETKVILQVGQETTALGLRIKVSSVLEDSRCPQDVECFWAGRIRVETRIVSGLGTSTPVFEAGQSTTTEAETITLISVLPEKTSKVEIKPSDYRFTFTVKKNEGRP